MLGRVGIAGVSSIFCSRVVSLSLRLIKALDEVVVASLVAADDDDDDVEGVMRGNNGVTCGGFNSSIGEFFDDAIGL